MQARSEAREAFSKEVEARTKIVAAKEESLKLLDEEYRKGRKGMSPQQRTEREDQLTDAYNAGRKNAEK